MRLLLAILVIIASVSIALAQTNTSPEQPYVWPQTVGTTSAQVLPSSLARKQIVFHNPNATATIAVCPAVSRKDSTSVTCVINGAGSITLVPGQFVTIAGVGAIPLLKSAWNGIASSPSSALTVFEFE